MTLNIQIAKFKFRQYQLYSICKRSSAKKSSIVNCENFVFKYFVGLYDYEIKTQWYIYYSKYLEHIHCTLAIMQLRATREIYSLLFKVSELDSKFSLISCVYKYACMCMYADSSYMVH